MGSLSSTQDAIIVGSLLGDGTLRKQGTRINALLEVNHAYKYKEYVDWKYNLLKEFILTPPKHRIGKGNRVAYRFTTRSIPSFTKYYNKFYVNGKKIIPNDLSLSSLALAVWFMDDGCKSRSSLYLNSQQFVLKEQKLLQELLWRSYKIDSSLNRDKQYWRIRITTASTTRMKDIISPYILPCFRYKLTYDPVTTDPKGEISFSFND